MSRTPSYFFSASPPERRRASGDRFSHARVEVPSNSEPISLNIVSAAPRLSVLFAIVGLVLVVFAGRLVELQIVHGQTYRSRSERNRLRLVTVPAPRGDIRDRFGRTLAESVPDFVLTVTPNDLPLNQEARLQTLDQLTHLTGVSRQGLEAAMTNPRLRATDPATILDHLTYERALNLMIQTIDLPGVAIQPVPTRSYPLGPAAAAVIGYIGNISEDELAAAPQASPLDATGKAGLEKTYNGELSGRDGQRQVEHDVQNREQRVTNQRPPEPGQTLVTSVDLELQQRLYDRLSQAVKSAHSPGGAAVALDPQTGQVLALVSLPSYDDNWFVTDGHGGDVARVLNDESKPLLNRAVAGQYPSGSIIKPIIATAALAERLITPNTAVISVGGFKVGADFFPDWKAGGHGLTNVLKALAESVNTFFYAIGGGYERQSGLGVDRMVKYLSLFGWGTKLGIDIPGETSGLLPTAEWRNTKRASPWKLGDTYHLAIGQGDVQVTPLQIAASVSAIANDGRLYQPTLVQQILDPNNQVAKQLTPRVLNQRVTPAASLEVVRQGMRQGVLAGSSRALQSLPVTSAGKTGTAQFGRQGKTHAWFAAFAPYDRPQIAIAVIVEAGGEGSAAAEPVAKDVLQWYFTRTMTADSGLNEQTR